MKLLNYLQNEKKLTEADLKKLQARPQVKCPHIIAALDKCFELACGNVAPTNKRYIYRSYLNISHCLEINYNYRYLVTIDVSLEAKKSHCIGSKYLTLLEAAVGYTIFLLRVEKNLLIATSIDDKLDLLSVGKSKYTLFKYICS